MVVYWPELTFAQQIKLAALTCKLIRHNCEIASLCKLVCDDLGVLELVPACR